MLFQLGEKLLAQQTLKMLQREQSAVILPPGLTGAEPWLDLLDDSKVLSRAQRERAVAAVRQHALAVGVGQASVEEIDAHNILRASHLAMMRAIAALPQAPDHVLVDGNLVPRDFPWPATAVVRGDTVSQSIAAASIVAKIRRDRLMRDLAQHFPGYGWETNAGYPTKSHKAALTSLGVTPHHRRSFKPVHNILYQAKNPTP